MEDILLLEFVGGVILLGSFVGVLVKYLKPVLKIGDRVDRLERHEQEIREIVEDGELSNRLLCKAMIGLIDSRLTGNNNDTLQIIKSDLMNFLTKNR